MQKNLSHKAVGASARGYKAIGGQAGGNKAMGQPSGKAEEVEDDQE